MLRQSAEQARCTFAQPPRKPPLIVLAVAIGLHLALVVSVEGTASKSSASDSPFAASALMMVRTIHVPAAPAAVVPLAVPSEGSPLVPAVGAIVAARNDARLTETTSIAAPKSASAGTPAVSLTTPVVRPPPKPEATTSAPSETLPAAPQYRTAGTLDPGPKPLGDINPDYPARAGQQQGIVVLRLLINEQGVVDNVAVVRATPAGYFEESALDAFGKALFSPGKMLGVAVKSQITVEVEFMPINRGATVSGRTY
jgi:periplasmic protein TonB